LRVQLSSAQDEQLELMREVATLRGMLKERDAEVLRLAATTAEQCARMLEADLAPLEAGWSSRRASSLG
jgi:hypothetical protein